MELYASLGMPRYSAEGLVTLSPDAACSSFLRLYYRNFYSIALVAVTVSDHVGNCANSGRKEKHLQSRQVIEHWIRLYNRLIGASYRMASWPGVDASETNVDAVCTDSHGRVIALEHARIGIQQREASAWRSVNGSGSPGARVIGSMLERKLLKLSAANADKRILLLESDSIAGSIEDQYARIRDEASVRSLWGGVDEIWGVLTPILESENVIFTNRIDPEEGDDRTLCSLNLVTGEFWRLGRDRIAR
jgi:hypothetical protein